MTPEHKQLSLAGFTVILPALRQSKLAARQVVCAAQMKQWALATVAYITDNNGALLPYADTCDVPNGQNALDSDTYWFNRLSFYLTREGYGKWGMGHNVRKCPMARANWGEKAVWVGVYYGEHRSDRAPFIYLNSWNGSVLTKKSAPFKANSVKTPAYYLMMLDVKRDNLFEPVRWNWEVDYDGDGMNDSNSGAIAAGLGPYNHSHPKIHRGGCNVALFDGHVEWIRYETFWEIGSDGFPLHAYWWNRNRP